MCTLQAVRLAPRPRAAALAAALLGLWLATSTTSAQGGANGYLVASPSAPLAGQEVAVDVRVENVENVAAFQATISWDPTALEFTQGLLGDFLESSEREVTFVPPIGEPGRLTFAAYSTSDAPRPGASGEGILFGAQLRTREPGTTLIVLEELLLADPENQPIGLDVSGDLRLTVSPPPTVYLPLTLRTASLR